MNRIATGILMASVCVSACTRDANAQQAGTFDKWIRTWSDEFPGTLIDSTKWNVSDYAPNKNDERQYYHPSSVRVFDDKLYLSSTNVPRSGRAYTSGEVTTLNKFSQKYGRIEARAKLPGTQGIWPAFWMLPISQLWPPEIDIMEILGHQPNTTHMSHHWGSASALQSFSQSWTGPNFTQDFHEFSVEWYPDALLWQVDGVQRAAHSIAVPQEPMYIILNTAVGGYWPGYPNGTTVFPQRYEIDWVRVYKCLLNSSFDQYGPTGNQALWSWNTFANVYADANYPRTGNRALKMFGPFSGSPNSSYVYQDFPAKPGEQFRASAYFQNRNEDPMAGANVAYLNIEWRASNGSLISTVSINALNASSPRNVYTKKSVSGVAPANTATARMAIVFYQPASTPGAAFIDDAEFGYFTPCLGDFNQDGAADFFDYLDFVDALSSESPAADFNGDSAIDFFDYLDFVDVLSIGC